MARPLFEYLTYDLGKRQLADFRLKPWAGVFLTLLDIIRLPLAAIVEWLLVTSGMKAA